MGFLREWLEGVARIKNPSLEAFVLRHGTEFTPAPLDRHTSRGAPRRARLNALELCSGRKGLRYCEGYALRIIPILHAWCVDENGVVVDPTLDDAATAYFGLPIAAEKAMGAGDFYLAGVDPTLPLAPHESAR